MPTSKDSGGKNRFRSYGKVDHKKIKKARFEAASLTSPEFKVLLKNPASQFLAFEKFNDYVASHENKTPKEKKASYDLILEYLNSSPNCVEIFDILSLKDVYFKPELAHVLKTLKYLLLAVKKEEYEEKLPQAGDAICRSLAAGHLQKIFNLVIHGKGRVVESAMSLLTTVANHSSAATRLLVSGITFIKEEIHALYTESGASKLRQPFIKLLLAIVNNASPPMLQAVIDEKGLLNGMLTQLHSDSIELIVQVLSTFESKILSNRMVTKTQRIRLFNETTIPHILQCYHWKKTVKRDTDKEKSGSTAELNLQRKVCQFVKTLLSDPKNGVTFTDTEYGQGQKNLNHVLNLVLCKSILNSAYSDEQLEEVVLSSLIVRPGQLHRYLAMLNESALLVKNADSWVTAANHVVKLMYSLPPFSHYVSPSSSMKEEMLCNIALALTSPPLTTMKIFKHVLNMTDINWQFISLGLLLVVMKRAKSAIDTVRSALSADKFETWRSLFVERFMQLVPQMDSLLHCWTAINKTIDKSSIELRANYAGRVLDLLVLHMELSPVSLHHSSMPINVSAILQDIENMAAHDTRADKSSIYAGVTVKALQLLGELGEEAGLAVMRMQKEKKSTLSRILELIYSSKDDEISLQSRQLLIKQLEQSSWFEKLSAELDVWFYYGDRLGDSLDFLEKLLQTLFSNPYPYLDQVYEAMSAVCEHKKQGRAVNNKPLPFSPIVAIALKLFSEYSKPAKAIQKYMQACMAEILLLQDDPLPLASLLSKHNNIGLGAVASVLLKPARVAKGCTLAPYNGLWNLFFCVDKPSPEAKTFDSLLEEVKSMSQTRSQVVALRYCLLALWYHQGGEGERGVASCVERLMSAMSDKLAVCTTLLQSGQALKWYLSEYTSGTMCVTSRLCNTALESLQMNQSLKLLQPSLEGYRSLLLRRLDAVTGMSGEVLSVTLQALSILAPTYSASQLFPVLHQLLIAKDCYSKENYWTCVQDCTKALFSASPINYTDISNRLDIIDLLLGLDSSPHKYRLAYEALKASTKPEVVPYSTWVECLEHCPSTSAEPQLLTWLIRESTSDEPVRKLLDSCDSENCTSQLAVIAEIISRLKTIDADEKFRPTFKAFTKELKRCIRSGELPVGLKQVSILKGLLPSAKEKHALKTFHLLLSAEVFSADANQDCLSLLLSTCRQNPGLYTDLFSTLISNVSVLSNDTVDYISTELSSLSMTSETLENIRDATSDEWKQFIFQALRANYDSGSWLRLARVMSACKYNEKGINTDLPAKDLLQLLTNHSKFLQVIMCIDSTAQLYTAKGELLSFMLLLVKLSPAACCVDHFPLLLGAYQGTLSANDRKLLHLMYLYEQAGVSTISYRPYLWGPAGVSYYSIKQNVSQSMVSEPNIESVLECIDQELLHKSAYNLCLDRPLSHQFVAADSNTAAAYDETLYDPSFLLPLFAYIMRPDNSLSTRLLIDTGVMTFVLSCLSSHVEEVRAAARFILYEFRQHMESSYYSETVQGVYVLDLIKESITDENARLSPVIAVFIARTLQLSPDEHMYRVCHNYLLIKPKMELELVPEFFRLFYSSSQKFVVERSWILGILLAGLREDADFRLYDKFNIFKIIMSYSQCSLCSPADRTVILEVIKKACSLPASAQVLIKYNVLGCFGNIVTSHPQETGNVLSAVKALVSAPASDKVWFGTFSSQLVTTLISQLKRLRTAEDSDTVVEVLYRSLILRENSHSVEDISPDANNSLLSQYEVDTILAYLPKTDSKYRQLLMRFLHTRLTSA